MALLAATPTEARVAGSCTWRAGLGSLIRTHRSPTSFMDACGSATAAGNTTELGACTGTCAAQAPAVTAELRGCMGCMCGTGARGLILCGGWRPPVC
eukprot:689992-Prymnesium_polylepis.1